MTSLEKQQVLISVGEKIRLARLHSDKTAKEIAAHLKITTQAYGKIERGRCAICVTRLIELAKFHHTSILSFLPSECNMILFGENHQSALITG
jgi:transcriptional regulator with XRE-family HTH domain